MLLGREFFEDIKAQINFSEAIVNLNNYNFLMHFESEQKINSESNTECISC